jgi:hypothetical protein
MAAGDTQTVREVMPITKEKYREFQITGLLSLGSFDAIRSPLPAYFAWPQWISA